MPDLDSIHKRCSLFISFPNLSMTIPILKVKLSPVRYYMPLTWVWDSETTWWKERKHSSPPTFKQGPWHGYDVYVSMNKHTQTHIFSPRYIKVYAGMQACANVNVLVCAYTMQILSKLRHVQKQWNINKWESDLDQPIEANLCCSYVHEYRGTHWSIANPMLGCYF